MWKGAMGAVAEHLNLSPSSDNRGSGCNFVELACLHCEEEFQRKLLCNHEENECLQRPYKCACCDDYESTFEDVTTKHIYVCPCLFIPCASECGESLQRKDLATHLETNCPLHVIECSFRYAGCEEKLPRKDMPAHIKDNLAEHMSLQAISTQQQLEKIKAEMQSLKTYVYSHLQIMPITLVMDDFSTNKELGKRWYSEPFYTHSCGYKMVLNVNCSSDDGTYVGVYICIRRSNLDHQLTWPFRGSIRIQLLDPKSHDERKHYTHVVTFGDKSEKCCYPDKDGWGYPRFIPHADLRPKYLKNDSISFRLTYVT